MPTPSPHTLSCWCSRVLGEPACALCPQPAGDPRLKQAQVEGWNYKGPAQLGTWRAAS